MRFVTPYVGVWIETAAIISMRAVSTVTPYVGVWIETSKTCALQPIVCVTPYVGVWIETIKRFNIMTDIQSLLMWECGLKQ